MLVLAILAFAPACSDNKVSKVRIKLQELPQDKKPAPNQPAPAVQPFECPTGGVSPLEASAFGTGHHKVFVKWNASQPSKEAPNEAVGYCLYRITKKNGEKKEDVAKKKDEVKKNPICPDCERINKVPVKGTACVDDLVQDGETYFYVAVAIAQNRDLSTTSNEVTVEIPRTTHAIGLPPPGIYPSCRVAPAENPSPASR
jgi:hypothetical protein